MGRELDNIDLTVSQRKEITALLKRYLPDTEVWAYGSRVKFTAKPSSDLDLVAFTSKDQNVAVANLREAFEESSLPFRVDLFIWDRVPKQFHKNIEAERVVLQKKAEKKNLPEGWEEISFTDAVTVNPTVKLIKGEEYPFVDMKSVDPSWREVTFSELRVFKSGGAKFLPKDTLMARITPCLENGKIARYMPKGKNDEAFGSTEFIVIRGKPGITNNDFAFYLTTWPEFREFAVSQMTGSSGRQRVPANSLTGFTFHLPPLPEQKAIAHILGSMDDKIELNRRMNKTLEAMAQALFKSWFVDFDPVIDNALAAGNEIPEELKERAKIRKVPGNARKPLPEEIRNLFPSEFEYTGEMGWIPKGWIETNIEDIAAKIAMGPFGAFIKVSTGIPIISGQHLNSTLLEDNTYNFITEEHAEKLKNSNVYRSDIIFTHAGNIGQVSYIPETSEYERYVLSQRQFYLRCDESKISPFFMIYFFRSPEGQHKILANTSSTGVPSISRPVSYLKMVEFIKPSDNIIEYFSQIIKDSHSRMGELAWEIKTLTKLRETLLPQLLSGELRIPDAEKLVKNLDKIGGGNGKS